MPDNKKEQERAELHRTIWKIADDLRDNVDGWDFKQYEHYRNKLLTFEKAE
jgi:type I restriction enzyme M protein